MSNRKPTIICITGPDGSGKSTLIASLVSELSNAKEVTIWDALNNKEVALFTSKKEVDNYLCILTPVARVLFLAHALKYAVDKALETGAETILLNAYYYKYFASEIALGIDQVSIKFLESLFPIPDKIIFLSVNPEICASRKKHLSRYECGCRDATKENFIDFQKKVSIAFETFIQPSWFVLESEESPKILKEKTLKIMVQ